MTIVGPVTTSARISDDFQFNYSFNFKISDMEDSNVWTIRMVVFTPLTQITEPQKGYLIKPAQVFGTCMSPITYFFYLNLQVAINLDQT